MMFTVKIKCHSKSMEWHSNMWSIKNLFDTGMAKILSAQLHVYVKIQPIQRVF